METIFLILLGWDAASKWPIFSIGFSLKQAYFDHGQNKLVHPYFDMLPKTSSEYKIIIELEPEEKDNFLQDQKLFTSTIEKKGCISVYIQSKLTELDGFNQPLF